MPSPKDITGDLSRRPQQRLKAGKERPPPPPRLALRPMAFDPLLGLTGLCLLAAVATEIAFLLWMW